MIDGSCRYYARRHATDAGVWAIVAVLPLAILVPALTSGGGGVSALFSDSSFLTSHSGQAYVAGYVGASLVYTVAAYYVIAHTVRACARGRMWCSTRHTTPRAWRRPRSPRCG